MMDRLYIIAMAVVIVERRRLFGRRNGQQWLHCHKSIYRGVRSHRMHETSLLNFKLRHFFLFGQSDLLLALEHPHSSQIYFSDRAQVVHRKMMKLGLASLTSWPATIMTAPHSAQTGFFPVSKG
jgi:hypothetical protein